MESALFRLYSVKISVLIQKPDLNYGGKRQKKSILEKRITRLYAYFSQYEIILNLKYCIRLERKFNGLSLAKKIRSLSYFVKKL